MACIWGGTIRRERVRAAPSRQRGADGARRAARGRPGLGHGLLGCGSLRPHQLYAVMSTCEVCEPSRSARKLSRHTLVSMRIEDGACIIGAPVLSGYLAMLLPSARRSRQGAPHHPRAKVPGLYPGRDMLPP